MHKAGSILTNKKDRYGQTNPGDVYVELNDYFNHGKSRYALTTAAKAYLAPYENEQGMTEIDEFTGETKMVVATREANYDIVKDARYYREQFRITLSYEKNTGCPDNMSGLRAQAQEYAKTANKVVIVRNMSDAIFVVVMDPNGKILETKNLNVIDGVDFYERLKEMEEKNRSDKSTKWEYEGTIQGFRDWYFVKAISEIARLVVEYKAVIIMERLSDRARDKYFAIGNNAFKKFETMLTARLADLHFEDVRTGDPGSLVNPYQFCVPAETNRFKSSYQDGIVFFVSGTGSRNTDPETGFICDFDVANIQTRQKKIQWLSKFDEIAYDPSTKSLKVAFDFDNFQCYKRAEQRAWSLNLQSGITVFNREHKFNKYISHPFQEVAQLLEKEGVDPQTGILDELRKAGECRITGNTVNMLFGRILQCLRGTIGSHDGERAQFVSPVTNTKVDVAVNIARNLVKSYEQERAE